MDRVNYDYHELEHPSILVELRKGEALLSSCVDITAKNLLLALIARHPDWLFIAKESYRANNTCMFTRFQVYEKQEYLGTLGSTERNGEAAYFLQNKRTAAKRKRGDSLITKDMKKAIKLLGKHLAPKTLQEKLEEATNDLRDAIEASYSAKVGAVVECKSYVQRRLGNYMEEHWEEVSLAAIQAGADRAKVEGYHEAKEDLGIISPVFQSLRVTSGKVVLVDGEDYVVDKILYSTETLTPKLREKIGLLKLVANGNTVKDVGFRLNEHAFYVIGVDDEEKTTG